MADNSKGRPASQRPSVYRAATWSINGGKADRKPSRGSNKNVDGVDRGNIDRLSEELRDAQAIQEVWDE